MISGIETNKCLETTTLTKRNQQYIEVDFAISEGCLTVAASSNLDDELARQEAKRNQMRGQLAQRVAECAALCSTVVHQTLSQIVAVICSTRAMS